MHNRRRRSAIMAVEVVGVHDVAVVPEPIPAALILLAAVKIEHPVELLLERRVLRRGLRRQRQRVAEHAGFDGSLRCGHDEGGLAQRLRELGSRARAGVAGSTHNMSSLVRATPMRRAETRLVVLVGDSRPPLYCFS